MTTPDSLCETWLLDQLRSGLHDSGLPTRFHDW
jgi:hypothetical protein